ncbi:MAG: sensor histidine kinase [Treponema sp.]|jgi:two-component system sensor histidine kinase YesM|nr:sensor histidine kinase [Treponema sp.]
MRRVLMVCFLSLFLSLLLMGGYLSCTLAQVIRDRELHQAQITLDRMALSLNAVFSNAADIANRVYMNPQIQQAATGQYQTALDIYTAYTGIAPIFDDYLHTYGEIAEIRLYLENPTLLNSSYIIVADRAIRESPWYRKAIDWGGRIFWTQHLDTVTGQKHISLIRQIKNVATGKHLGVLVINLGMGNLEHLYASDPYDTSILLDGQTVLSSHKDSGRAHYVLTRQFVPRQTLNNTVEITCAIPKKALFAPVYAMVRRCAVIVALVLGVSLVSIFFVLDNTRNLQNEVFRQKLQQEQLFSRQKEMQLKILSNQINPHFLYNTLETIRMMALAQSQDSIAGAVKMLSRILRQSLNAGEKTVPLETEIALVRDYLNIQKIRFSGRISFDIAVDEDAAHCQILPLLVQPLAENSFVHGLENRPQGGHIAIRGTVSNGLLTVEVADNGAGMDAKRLAFIRSRLNSPEPNEAERIGLANVSQRLQLFYGPASGLDISPGKDGTGIRVTLTIPETRDV